MSTGGWDWREEEMSSKTRDILADESHIWEYFLDGVEHVEFLCRYWNVNSIHMEWKFVHGKTSFGYCQGSKNFWIIFNCRKLIALPRCNYPQCYSLSSRLLQVFWSNLLKSASLPHWGGNLANVIFYDSGVIVWTISIIRIISVFRMILSIRIISH